MYGIKGNYCVQIVKESESKYVTMQQMFKLYKNKGEHPEWGTCKSAGYDHRVNYFDMHMLGLHTTMWMH